jgi:trans-2,3-dihydro-3-hydroxyanthranilate isomerase
MRETPQLGQDDAMLDYDIVDVFAERPFAGNQLAVVHGAEELSSDQLQTIAREFNFSETTFPTSIDADHYDVRIFTPGGEVPFAGHPTLGTAWVLRDGGLLSGDQATQHCAAGEIGVSLDGELVRLTAVPRDLAGPLSPAAAVALLADLGLAADDLAGDTWVAGTGLTFVHLPVRADAVARARPSLRPLSEYGDAPTRGCSDPVEGINVYAATDGSSHVDIHARVFVPGLSVDEDPATGSAAAGLGMALVATGRLPLGGRYEISQGSEMGRPSRLHGEVVVTTGNVEVCRVAGRVQPIAKGRIAVPGQA